MFSKFDDHIMSDELVSHEPTQADWEEVELEDDLFIVLDGSDICPNCGKQGGEYTPTLDECAFC